MTSVASAIATLLYDHDTVIVPGLGAFVRHDQSAHVNVITNEFQRPSSQLSFDPRQREENTLVIEALMASNGLTNDEARTAIATFVSDSFAQLKADGTVSLPGLGTLTMDEQQNLVFEPDDNNFNGDAFGLEDLNPEPIYNPTTQGNALEGEEASASVIARSEATKQPVGSSTEGRKSNQNPPEKKRSHWWLWLLLLLLVAGAVALWYFKFRPVPTKPWPVPALQRTERPQLLPTISADTLVTPTVTSEDTTKTIPGKTPTETLVDTPTETTVEPPVETPKPETPKVTPSTSGAVKVVAPEPTSKAFIVGGCFAVEQNALNMTTEAREQGCAEAFVMKRGTKYYVCYGQYPSNADAKAALPEILKKYNQKAWILTK